ncbi:10487_t:CDS:1 [Funneliformis geosporum]|uniref:10487_t:CDS:1 n=1 Tax=Funneliformis geosporum TaxID=1117311 RepID=A0A9W4STW1_9GLOM|nr:10487_t:CDS:1 [Funneliformis geosporum]
MSAATQHCLGKKSSIPYIHSNHKSTMASSYQQPTESMIEAAKIDYATRLFVYTRRQLQQVSSSPSRTRSQENKSKKVTRNGVKDYNEIRGQRVKEAKRNW